RVAAYEFDVGHGFLPTRGVVRAVSIGASFVVGADDVALYDFVVASPPLQMELEVFELSGQSSPRNQTVKVTPSFVSRQPSVPVLVSQRFSKVKTPLYPWAHPASIAALSFSL